MENKMNKLKSKRPHITVDPQIHDLLRFTANKLERELGHPCRISDILLFVTDLSYEELREKYIISFNRQLKIRGLLK